MFTLQDVQKAAEEMLSTRPKGSIELVLCFDVIVTTPCDSRGRPLSLCRQGALKRSARFSAYETSCSVNFILKWLCNAQSFQASAAPPPKQQMKQQQQQQQEQEQQQQCKHGHHDGREGRRRRRLAAGHVTLTFSWSPHSNIKL